jgi:hypothetical protein
LAAGGSVRLQLEVFAVESLIYATAQLRRPRAADAVSQGAADQHDDNQYGERRSHPIGLEIQLRRQIHNQ